MLKSYYLKSMVFSLFYLFFCESNLQVIDDVYKVIFKNLQNSVVIVQKVIKIVVFHKNT